MRSEEINPAYMLVLQQRELILETIVANYTNPTPAAKENTHNVVRQYAVVQRDYWGHKSAAPDARAFKQIWTDALVRAGTENDWSTMKLALQNDILNFRDFPSTLTTQRMAALSNLVLLL